MELLHAYVSAEWRLLAMTFSAGSPYGAPSLLGALIVSAAWYVHRRRSRGRGISMRGFVRSLFTSRILGHPSTLIDLKLWALNGLVLMLSYTSLAVSGLALRHATLGALNHALGAHDPLVWPLWTIMIVVTFAQLLSYEFAYWFGHYLFHRYEWLWEFHKVHHSAEVMSTLTELRQHPIEILAFMNLIGVATGCTLGGLSYVFGPGAEPFTLLNANVVLMIFLLTWGHLRHSHIWISFTGLAGRLFQSPAHHQIHHSDNPAHFNKNLGYALAVWDWAFGTLYIPSREPEHVVFGVGERNGDYDTVTRTFVRPFLRSAEHLTHAAPHPEPASRPQA